MKRDRCCRVENLTKQIWVSGRLWPPKAVSASCVFPVQPSVCVSRFSLLLSQHLSECEDGNYAESTDYMEGFKGTGTFIFSLLYFCELASVWRSRCRRDWGGQQQPHSETQGEGPRKDQISQRSGQPVGSGAGGRWVTPEHTPRVQVWRTAGWVKLQPVRGVLECRIPTYSRGRSHRQVHAVALGVTGVDHRDDTEQCREILEAADGTFVCVCVMQHEMILNVPHDHCSR